MSGKAADTRETKSADSVTHVTEREGLPTRKGELG